MITSGETLVTLGVGILNTVAGHMYRQCLGVKSIEICFEKLINSSSLDQGIQFVKTTKLNGMIPDFIDGAVVTLASYKAMKCLTNLCHTLQDPQMALASKVQKSAIPAFSSCLWSWSLYFAEAVKFVVFILWVEY